MYMFNTWVNKSAWHYSTGMLLQDMTLFPGSMVREKNCLECVGSISWNNKCVARFSLGSTDIADDNLALIERFVVLLFDRIGSAASVNGARHWLFTKNGRSMDNCRPTLNALLQHIYSFILQRSSWRQTQNVFQLLADWSKFGWDGASPIFVTNTEATKSCQEFVKCGY